MRVRIKDQRTLEGLSLAALSEKSGVSAPAISRIENHKQHPRPSTMRRLADALGVSVADLWEETTETGKLAA